MTYTKEQQIGKRSKPKRKERTRIKAKDYQRVIDEWGESCFCGSTNGLEMHHIRTRAQLGRGGWRNLILLCKHHHMKAHNDYSFRKNMEIQRRRKFGQYFYMDKYDLCEKGLIDDPTDELFERYFYERVIR